jgi:biopolymer transport protein ExbB
MRNLTKIALMLMMMMVVISAFMCCGVYAQDNAGAEAEEVETERDISLWDTIKAGGPIEFLIILISVAALALIIENFVTLKVENYLPHDLLMDYEELFETQNYEEALAIGDTEDCMLSRVFSAGLIKQNSGFASMEDAVGDAAAAEIGRLQSKVGVLALIANIAPMLGLLGTVTGMIIAFNEIATNPNPTPSDLAYGISQALITTCTGLIVAIPVSAAYFFLRNRVSQISNELAIVAGDFLDKFRVES